jgi:hypothetical protein
MEHWDRTNWLNWQRFWLIFGRCHVRISAVTLIILSFLVVSVSASRKILGQYLKLGHNRCLSPSFQFSNHFYMIIRIYIVSWRVSSSGIWRRVVLEFQPTVRRNLSPQSSGSKKDSACRQLARWFAEPISSTLKLEAISSSETSVETQRHHIPEDNTFQNHRCENLKSYIHCKLLTVS